jgi:tRNA G10  N-methylase Trm11
MTIERQEEIRQQLVGYYRSYQNDGEPIAVNFRSLVPELSKLERYTHLIHSYPAKLLANIPFYFFATDELCPQEGTVLDPFCGTGTVLLEAALSGRTALGADANPLAELITNVKTHHTSCETLTNTLAEVLKRAKLYRHQTEHPEAVAVWYSPSSLRQLSNIQLSVREMKNIEIRPFFELCFSCVARKVSYADPSISVPVHWNPERFSSNPNREEEVRKKLESLKNVNVYDKFEAICKANIARVGTLTGRVREGVEARIVSNDARHLGLEDNSVDLILTSPPYAGAQKYIRASWLNLYWLNMVSLEGVRELKRHNIGREDYRKDEISESYTGIEPADKVLKDLYGKGKTKRAFLAANYLNEMKVALDESCRVLKQNGYMVIVIGNNTVCGQSFDTQDYLTNYLVGKGMQLQYKLIDDIKSYGLMTKRNKTANTITREWILVFKK